MNKINQGKKSALRDGLYHKDLHEWVKTLDFGTTVLEHTVHVLQRAAEKSIRLPSQIRLRSVVEAEVRNGRIAKLVVRQAYDARFDVCIVVVPTLNGTARAVTAWLNLKTDAHTTLNRGAYVNVA